MNNWLIYLGIMCLAVTVFSCCQYADSEVLASKLETLKAENDSLRAELKVEDKGTELGFTTKLSGTTFLPYSSKMIGLMNRGIEPIKFEVIKECEPQYIDNNDYPKFISIERTSSSLVIDVEIIGGTCRNYLGEAEIKGEDTLNLIYTDYGGFCSSGPCTIRYSFNTSLEKAYQTLKYVTVNGNSVVGTIPNY